jgi:hypothetical protein
MAIITLPTGILFGAGSGVEQITYDITNGSAVTGADQPVSFGPARWGLTLLAPDRQYQSEAAAWEVLVLQLRGRLNVLACHDPGKPAPRGTRRGSLALGAAAAAGATSVNVTGTGTLLRGDWLQIGTGLGTSQLVKVVADTSTAAVQIEPPLRSAHASGTVVTWDKPLGYWRRGPERARWTYTGGGLQQGFALQFVEAFS